VATTGDGLIEAVDNASSLIPCGHIWCATVRLDNVEGFDVGFVLEAVGM